MDSYDDADGLWFMLFDIYVLIDDIGKFPLSVKDTW
jgi:hypothetical protein